MLLIPTRDGHVAVTQPEHGRMCGALARAWGNRAVGEAAPREHVCRAAELHDDGWLEWERHPTLDRRAGLPHTFQTAPFDLHLRIHSAWSHALAEREPYEGLLVSLHHASFFRRPDRLGRLRGGGRRIAAFLDDLEGLQRDLLARTGVSPDEVERDRRLVRTWDGLSHDLLLGLAPRVRRGVPTADGLVDLEVRRERDTHTISPWPFADDEVVVGASGRELPGRFDDEEDLRRALEQAPMIELRYVLRAEAAESAPSISDRSRS